MKGNSEQQFRKSLELFYSSAIANHSLKYTLKNRFKKFVDRVNKECLNIPETANMNLGPRMQNNSAHQTPSINEFSSMKLMPTKQSKQNNHLTVSRSRTNITGSHKSSIDYSDSESKMFSFETHYHSKDSSITLLFGILASIILTDNKVAFKYFEDKINDALPECNFSELILLTIGNNWQRVGDLVSQGKAIRWHRPLKELVDKFPTEFTQLVCRIILGLDHKVRDFMSENVFSRWAKQLKVTINFFLIKNKQIQEIRKIGKTGKQMFIGHMSHLNRFVIANKLPQYSKQELHLRALRNSCSDSISTMIESINNNDESYSEFRELMKPSLDQQKLVREHFKNKLSESPMA